MSAFTEPRTVVFNTEMHGFYYFMSDPHRLCVSFENGTGSILYKALITAIQTCEDIGHSPAFNKQVLVDAIEALRSNDPERVLTQSEQIGREVERFRKACSATNAGEASPKLKASDPLSKIKPDGREADVLIAMLTKGVTSPASRSKQQDILDNALGKAAAANDHRRVFATLKELALVCKGENGLGFYLTSTGISAAEKLQRALEATRKPPTDK